jgi:hypothetical protein
MTAPIGHRSASRKEDIMIKGTVLAAIGAFMIATVALIGPASPDEEWDEWMYTEDADPGGVVRFKADGDVVEVCDLEADGWAVEVQVYYDWPIQDFTVYEYQIGGEGRCQTLRASLGGNYNLGEGQVYGFRVCLDKRGTEPKYCDYAYWKA